MSKRNTSCRGLAKNQYRLSGQWSSCFNLRFFDIIWSGVDKKDEVDLYYSIDDGAIWNLIAQKVTGLHYKWKSPGMNTKIRLRAQISDKWDYDYADSYGTDRDETFYFNSCTTKWSILFC